jgi:hypothetical protein
VITIIGGAYAPLDIFFLVLGVVAFGFEAWAFVDAVIRPAQAFPAVGKLTKTKWLFILGAAFALGLYSAVYGGFGNFLGPAGFLLAAAFAAAAIYLSDVRPRVREFKSGTRMGPYGPW